MKMTGRQYTMTARAEAAAQTARDIMAAAVALWREQSLDEITLQEIADRAGVTVQTVIRRFGSKDGLFEACIDSDAGRVREERNSTPHGSVEQALDTLLEHYERDGDAVIRTLALEDRLEAARKITAIGRREHRAWCARVFGPNLSQDKLDAFVAATDIYLWKLLRRDLGRSLDETRKAIRALINGLISTQTP